MRTESSGGGLVRVRIDRPPVNVLGAEDLRELADGISAAGRSGVRVILLAGLPRAFSAGVSIPEHAPEPAMIERMLAAMRAALSALLETSAVTIAAVSGACLGGGAEIASACDLVLAAEDARIGFPEIRVACFPPGAVALLPLRIGAARAADWILSGRTVSGREAAEAGFASRAVPPAEVEREAEKLAHELLSRAPAALSSAAQLLRAERRRALEQTMSRAEEAYRRLGGDPDLARAVKEWKK
ncbi:MAG TPA: enoyl-CoA hydratase/isomerase family protein [Thermoanaerobaculia bacterium]|nr:enoyl-CoA hydratase/isomerase family protein [Thermoanaerobaculia bacterium]